MARRAKKEIINVGDFSKAIVKPLDYQKLWYGTYRQAFGDNYAYLVNDLDGTLVTLKDCLDEGIEQLFESEGWLEDNDEY